MNSGFLARISLSHKKMWILAALASLSFMSPLARLLVYVLPCFSLVLAVDFIRKDKTAYIEFVCWLYMLTPLVRRYIDYKTGASETIVMVAPYVAVAVCLWVLLPRWTEVFRTRNAALLCVLAAIVYASATTVFQMLLGGLGKGIVAWLMNLLFAFYLVMERKYIREMYVGFERAMVYGTLVVGVYGVLQYFVLPDCDRVWLEMAELVSFGAPLPMEVRVFSTMNAPQVLGAYLLVGIFIAYGSSYRIKFVSVFAGLASLLLSMSRSSWVAFLAGALFLAFRLPTRERKKIFVIGAICMGTILIGMQVPSLNETLSDRFRSLTDSNDNSAYDRTKTYSAVFQSIASSPFGLGLGVEGDEKGSESISDAEHDSSLVNLLLSFGVIGSIVFCSGLFGASYRIILASNSNLVIPLTAIQASLFALIAEAAFNNILTGPIAFLTWCIVGLGYAAMETRVGARQQLIKDAPVQIQPEVAF